MQTTPAQNWRFIRAGGFDQVRLDTAQELLNIGALDQKLWVALSCPIKGIEFDAQTLAAIDSDGDGTIRAADLIAAVEWTRSRLSNTDVLAQALDGVPLSAIKQDDDIGAQIVAAAREVLAEQTLSTDLVTVAAADAAQGRLAQRAQQRWEAQGAEAQPLGDATANAYAALQSVREKVDDWFVRCRLTAFDARAGEALNASADALAALGGGALRSDSEGIAALPLAHVRADASLPLGSGVNPAWSTRIEALHTQLIVPLLGVRESLSAEDWQQIKDQLQPYANWLADKPDPQAQMDGARDLEKLARLVRDLLALANNFVAFRDFYGRQKSATFQIGTLYLDGRSCDLCVAVNDAAKHAALASLARICLVYVDCVRGGNKMSVAAAITAGDSDQLMVGRNGVFYDRQGQDWTATITKIVDHPISLRQAFWAPYKRLARLVHSQIQKVAANSAQASDRRMDTAATHITNKVTGITPATAAAAPAAAPVPSAAFDVAKFAGIFAAIGLAVGALGSALAAVMTGLFALRIWQIPLVFVGLLLLVSGPAVVLAWFKLRSRNLGPILDANGWAINARARISIPLGTSLTQVAVLPPHAERTLTDPYAEKRTPWALYAGGLLALAAAGWWLAEQLHF